MRKNALVIALLSVFFIQIISSAGVANSYWDDNPLKLAPGEEKRISLRLQNEETSTITMEASLNSEIASLADNNVYNIPPNKVSVPVYIDVEIPKDASVGTEYIILVSFKQISSGEGEGFFQVAQGITSKIPVEVVGEQESELYGVSQGSNSTIYVILGVIALVIILFFLRKKKN